jgi:hypothetical protein
MHIMKPDSDDDAWISLPFCIRDASLIACRCCNFGHWRKIATVSRSGRSGRNAFWNEGDEDVESLHKDTTIICSVISARLLAIPSEHGRMSADIFLGDISLHRIY